ncbi:type VI secretion system baseplate subunit TssK [Arsenophonus nasoniae]|uniref:Type VI secretion system baseplate subunit TssK n=2 Tax=Arsenophonus nasoniae TaxID=638 RepID=A0AA95GAI6_9GAMM|nr:type VI secretion system baseplate subunit TssK [Arsenophonus nasoniae]WGL95037.1 type VI secretion system baseplate subunit TssK [Arsenophonus nasoniae]
MLDYKPIYWFSGLYLQPQHLQTQQLHDEYWRARYQLLTKPWAWGVINISFHQAALHDEELRIYEGQFILPNGVYADCNVNAIVAPRSLRDCWQVREKPVLVYIGLRQISHNQNNVTCVAKASEITEQTTRWVSWPTERPVRDLYGNGTEVQLQQMSYNLRFFLHDEIAQLTGYTLLPIGRLRQGSKGIEWDSDYFPPSMTLKAVPWLWQRIDNLCLELTGRLHQFEEFKRPPMVETGELNQRKDILLLAMRTLSRYVIRLQHYKEAQDIHPWKIVGLLKELIAELTCFTDLCSFNGVCQWDNTVAPSYDHHDIAASLKLCERKIMRLLDNLMIKQDNVISFAKQSEGYFSANWRLAPQQNYVAIYLVMRSEQFVQQEYEVPDDRLIKMAAKSQIDTIITRSLAGVRLHYQIIPPQGLPQKMNSCYFKVEERSPAWEEIKNSGNIILHWPEAPEDLQIDLILARSY